MPSQFPRVGRRRAPLVLALLLVVADPKTLPSLAVSQEATPERGRSVNWERARAASARYRTVLDLSGLVETDRQIPMAVDAEDLDALCRARRASVGLARKGPETTLRDLGEWRDPAADDLRSAALRTLGAVALFEGDVETAVRRLEAARDALAPYLKEYPDLRPRFFELEQAVGIAHLRRGEMDNCLVNASADRCLFPLRPGGHHHDRSGARAAVDRFRAGLAHAPDNLEVRWLLNLAYMVLGRYPKDVPKNQLLSPSLFRSEATVSRFTDVAAKTGLGRMDVAGGTITDDFDGDGLTDVVFSSVDFCSPLRLYRNRGDGGFEDRTEAAGLLRQLGGLNTTQTDYNNDGRIDIFVMRGGWELPMRNSLLRNNGDGTFTDVTREAGLSSGSHSTHSVAWGDFDNDGWLDVFVGHELTPSQLFRNRGDGTFEDVSRRAGVGATAFTKGVVFGDYDKDGFPDLYVSNMFGDNFLYHNNGDGTFTEVATRLGVHGPLPSFPTWFFDYDNDGWLDIFVASYPQSLEEFVKHYLGLPPSAETLVLYRNKGDGTFTDVTRKVRLDRVIPAMGANFGDLDNDGFLDIYLGTGTPSFGSLMPNIMLKNDAGQRFLDVTEASGTGHLQKGHGVAFADLDHDGDEDVVVNVGGAVPGDSYDEALFENPGTGGNNWISLKLLGVRTNRAAIGARITLHLRGAPEGSALRYREVTSGGSFGSSSLTQHIGLGRATIIDSLEVYWPVSRKTQLFQNVPVNRFLQIREGEASYSLLEPKRFVLGSNARS